MITHLFRCRIVFLFKIDKNESFLERSRFCLCKFKFSISFIRNSFTFSCINLFYHFHIFLISPYTLRLDWLHFSDSSQIQNCSFSSKGVPKQNISKKKFLGIDCIKLKHFLWRITW